MPEWKYSRKKLRRLEAKREALKREIAGNGQHSTAEQDREYDRILRDIDSQRIGLWRRGH